MFMIFDLGYKYQRPKSNLSNIQYIFINLHIEGVETSLWK